MADDLKRRPDGETQSSLPERDDSRNPSSVVHIIRIQNVIAELCQSSPHAIIGKIILDLMSEIFLAVPAVLLDLQYRNFSPASCAFLLCAPINSF